MYKKDRQKQSEIFVVGFVPTYLLPERRPVALDPFLLPLLEEIEDGFINGVKVDNYQPRSRGLSSSRPSERGETLIGSGHVLP